jgi:hypothetical protein
VFNRLSNSLIFCGALARTRRRFGGYVSVTNLSGSLLLCCAIGDFSVEKRADYIAFSQEKAVRLAANASHSLSSQSREPDLMKFGGAVKGENIIVSFSGCPEEVDELISVLVLRELDELTREKAKELLALSGNSYAETVTL